MPNARHFAKAMGAMPKFKDGSKIGLAQNNGTPFQCGTCEYFDNGLCRNDNPALKGRKVELDWCCNLYDHEGMKVIV